MKVVIASRNPLKVGASRDAFETLFPGDTVEMTSVSVESGASDSLVMRTIGFSRL